MESKIVNQLFRFIQIISMTATSRFLLVLLLHSVSFFERSKNKYFHVSVLEKKREFQDKEGIEMVEKRTASIFAIY